MLALLLYNRIIGWDRALIDQADQAHSLESAFFVLAVLRKRQEVNLVFLNEIKIFLLEIVHASVFFLFHCFMVNE